MINTLNLETIVEQAIIDVVSTHIAQILKQREQHKVAVLFTATPYGFDDALGALQKLNNAQCTIKLIFSKNAQLLFKDKLKDIIATLGKVEQVIYEGDGITDGYTHIANVLQEVQVLYVPSLSINTAAKVTHGICDSLPSQLLFEALAKRVKTIAAYDGCCPKNKQRLAEGFNTALAHKEKLTANLRALKAYGIELVAAHQLVQQLSDTPSSYSNIFHQLFDDLEKNIVPAFTHSQVKDVKSVKNTTDVALSASTQATFNQKVFSRQNAVLLSPQVSSIRISAYTLVTPSAEDELRKRQISIIKE